MGLDYLQAQLSDHHAADCSVEKTSIMLYSYSLSLDMAKGFRGFAEGLRLAFKPQAKVFK